MMRQDRGGGPNVFGSGNGYTQTEGCNLDTMTNCLSCAHVRNLHPGSYLHPGAYFHPGANLRPGANLHPLCRVHMPINCVHTHLDLIRNLTQGTHFYEKFAVFECSN